MDMYSTGHGCLDFQIHLHLTSCKIIALLFLYAGCSLNPVIKKQ